MSPNVTVRALRPHDTVEGAKAPGDEYERSSADAEDLEARGVVAIVAAKGIKKRRGSN